MTRKRYCKFLRSIYSPKYLTRKEFENKVVEDVLRFGSYEIAWHHELAVYYMTGSVEPPFTQYYRKAWTEAQTALYMALKTNGLNFLGEPIDISNLKWLEEFTHSECRAFPDSKN